MAFNSTKGMSFSFRSSMAKKNIAIGTFELIFYCRFRKGQTLNYLFGLVLSSGEEVENYYIGHLMTLKSNIYKNIWFFFN